MEKEAGWLNMNDGETYECSRRQPVRFGSVQFSAVQLSSLEATLSIVSGCGFVSRSLFFWTAVTYARPTKDLSVLIMPMP